VPDSRRRNGYEYELDGGSVRASGMIFCREQFVSVRVQLFLIFQFLFGFMTILFSGTFESLWRLVLLLYF